jgi:hypothetical protein
MTELPCDHGHWNAIHCQVRCVGKTRDAEVTGLPTRASYRRTSSSSAVQRFVLAGSMGRTNARAVSRGNFNSSGKDRWRRREKRGAGALAWYMRVGPTSQVPLHPRDTGCESRGNLSPSKPAPIPNGQGARVGESWVNSPANFRRSASPRL